MKFSIFKKLTKRTNGILFIFILSYSPFIFSNPCAKVFSKNRFSMVQLIDNKALKKEHTKEEIFYIVDAFTRGDIPDYQMSAWAMSVRLNGLSRKETGFLTEAMTLSGRVLNFKGINRPVVDKHSTGGVGDKVSLILTPLCASCGLVVPMISGRGLGHTGGTLDKLESLVGFNTALSKKEMEKQIKEVGSFITGQTEDIAPADKKIYALRDVTATVNAPALISASIMSKKLSEGLDALVMDVKFGSGGFMKTKEEAIALASELKHIAEYNNVKFRGLITNMDQPLGRFVGNSLEAQEALTILKNEIPPEQESYYNSTKDLSLHLAAHMLHITNKVETFDEAYEIAQRNLENGSAFKLFEKMCEAQGACQLKLPKNKSERYEILSPKEGYVTSMDTKNIGMSSIFLGAGRLKKEDSIDHEVGIEMNIRLGDFMKKGHPLAILYYSKKSDLKKSEEFFIQSIGFSDSYSKPPQLIETSL